MDFRERLKKLKPQAPKGIWRNVAIFFAVLGPGIITANVDNDAGGIATYSIAGADFGYSFLWLVIPVVFALIVIQEMSARMGAVTGKGLADLIRENYGAKVTFYVMLALLITNLGNTMAEFAGVAASLEIFGISKYITVPISAFFVWFLVVKGTYKTVEKVFLIACLFYVAYIISGFMAQPNWSVVGRELISPSFSFDTPYLYMTIGIVGTTIAPWMQFYMQSSIVEKGIDIETYRQSRWDVLIGCIMAGVVVFFIIVACAATLNPAGIRVESAADAALALKPLAGDYCSFLFAFGLFNASLFAASVLPLSTAYYVCEGLGWEAGVDKDFDEAPQFYGLYTAIIILGAVVILIPDFPLFFIMVFSQVINGVLLPFVLIFMLLLINRKDLMGEFTNGKIWNFVSWFTVVAMIILTLLMIFTFF
ncbi:MAG: Nramp family divalent metal transporter [Deltaproteobacteria bacterium]|jgi:Mn2+/Fe2+ NRAMP family transporter|nr:Nramp family divalent metal transporter [Deltaproteobacteria bacterium]